MKLRIKGDSVRLRLARSEVRRLVEAGRVEETTHFAAGGTLGYVLQAGDVCAVEFNGARIVVTLPETEAREWAAGEQVGIYRTPESGVQLAVEKDFECLDREDPDKADAYPNPRKVC